MIALVEARRNGLEPGRRRRTGRGGDVLPGGVATVKIFP